MLIRRLPCPPGSPFPDEAAAATARTLGTSRGEVRPVHHIQDRRCRGSACPPVGVERDRRRSPMWHLSPPALRCNIKPSKAQDASQDLSRPAPFDLSAFCRECQDASVGSSDAPPNPPPFPRSRRPPARQLRRSLDQPATLLRSRPRSIRSATARAAAPPSSLSLPPLQRNTTSSELTGRDRAPVPLHHCLPQSTWRTRGMQCLPHRAVKQLHKR